MSKKNRKHPSYRTKQKKSSKNSMFQNIWAIVRNQKDTNGQYTQAALSWLISLTLNELAAILALCGVLFIWFGAKHIIAGIVSGTAWYICAVSFIILFFAVAVCAALALLLRGMANEAERERDRNYVVAIFSGFTSFAALIIALIALLKK